MRSLILFSVLVGLLLVSRPAHALFGALGSVGYGRVFGGDAHTFGPTIEVGGSFSPPIISIDLTYWRSFDEDDSSQIRLGARLKPPLIPVYGRLAAGFSLDDKVRDAAGLDVIFGVGYEFFSLPLVNLVFELDYHKYIHADDTPLELKLGAIIGF